MRFISLFDSFLLVELLSNFNKIMGGKYGDSEHLRVIDRVKAVSWREE